MRIITNLFVITIVLFVFSGCTSFVTTNVTIFHELSDSKNKEKQIYYSFGPILTKSSDMEYKLYKSKIKKYLLKNNYVEKENSDNFVVFEYFVDKGRTKLGSSPIIGQTGVSASKTVGTINSFGTFSGNTTYTPVYGVTGSSTYTYTEYGRILELSIYSKGPMRKVYEGIVASVGSNPNLLLVIDEMIEALFNEFPGENGTSKKIKIPFEN